MHAAAVEIGAGLAAQEDLLVGADDHAAVPVDVVLEPVLDAEPAQPLVLLLAFPRNAVGDDRLDLELDQHLGKRETADDETGAAGKDAAKMPPDRVVDRLAIGAVGDVQRDLADVFERRAGFLEQDLDVLHRLIGLRRRVAGADEVMVEVEAGLAAQEDAVAGAHRHAHLVRAAFPDALGIVVAAQSRMGHDASLGPALSARRR